jgi:hypothetical protein
MEDSNLSMVKFMNGLILAPMMISLHKYLVNWDYHQSISYLEQHQCSENSWDLVINLFSHLKLCNNGDGKERVQLSNRGKFFLERALNMGVAVSYKPLLCQVEELFTGSPSRILAYDSNGNETHVDRTLNVIGSGSMHGNYFTVLCETIGEIFNNEEDLESQPRFICDMGCGDGHLLSIVYKYISQHTKRGLFLEKYPLLAIGVDFNKAALEETQKTLQREGIPHKVLYGDIGDPEQLLKI